MSASRLRGWWYDYADRQYMKHCGTVWWRFWFEVTGQGRGARRYAKATGMDVPLAKRAELAKIRATKPGQLRRPED